VDLIKELYNQAWERNWGFVPLTEPEIDHLAKQLKPIAVPDLVPFAVRDGKVVGFAVALPDLNVALRHNPSGRLWACRSSCGTPGGFTASACCCSAPSPSSGSGHRRLVVQLDLDQGRGEGLQLG